MMKNLFKLFSKKSGEEKKPLNLYQYKFLRYKTARREKYPLTLSEVETPAEKGLISVVLPVYNGADLVAQSIDSVLAQTWTNFELIAINDGSTDGTLEILKQYQAADSRVVVVDQENRRIPRTLSRGFEMARGEFFTWTSADNIMHPQFLEKMAGELQAHPDWDMVYANMRLINAEGKIYKGHGWFEVPLRSGNVILPANAFELNTYANNTIAAAFMYRSAAADVAGDYSRFKHTLEDYDYWMRINSLCELKHVDFSEPVYDYRWHDGSLTAKDAELGITKNRYKLMVLDDFRRDFYLSPLLWYLDSDEEGQEFAAEFRQVLETAGHIVLEKEDFSHLFFGRETHRLCYVSFGKTAESVNLPKGAQKVSVMPGTERVEGFDIYITRGAGELPRLHDHAGWFRMENARDMFAFLDAKVKNALLYRMEEIIETEKTFEKKLSVILCTHKNSKRLKECLQALCSQSAAAEDYEIVFVNNNFSDTSIKELVFEIRAQYPQAELNYITAPVGGLSYARNVGLWEARGEFLLYVDDDAIADNNLIKETIACAEAHPEAGVIGGQILLVPPEPAPEVLTDEVRPLWSELVIAGENYREAKNYGEFPYGANFGVRTQSLMQVGGFRCTYGRIGNNYGGGEETQVCFMMEQIHQKVGLNPRAKVAHKVDAARFTSEHIEKTAYAGLMTQYQMRKDLYAPLDWTDHYLEGQAKACAAECAKWEKGSPQYLQKDAQRRAYEEILKKRGEDYNFLARGQDEIV